MTCRILEASFSFRNQPFARPLQLSSGTITEITGATATVRVEAGGRVAEGRGCIYLSDLWAWPDPDLPHEIRDASMRNYCQHLAHVLPDRHSHRAHPLQLGMEILSGIHGDDSAERPPLLAALVCMSPLDAAIHDACGKALAVPAFRLYGDDVPAGVADSLFPGTGAIPAVRRFLHPVPQEAVDGWYVVSGTDPLAEDFAMFVRERGFRCFKLKTHGRDPEADARRTVEVFRAARQLGVARPRLSADSNEGNPDAASVGAYLDALEAMDPDAYAALEYLEQPTGRDIRTHAFDWRPVAARKPVLVDEGLMDPELLPLLEEQGWSGICLKTCKGHSFNLVAGAWAHARGMKVAVQDLTNPGIAAIHSCLLAMYTPSMNGVELNSPQFTPAANEPWLPAYGPLFAPADGRHRVPDPLVPGLGA